jgi:hypothetical protein
LSRRNFLKVVAAAGATAAAGSALSFYAPWLDYGQAARHTGVSFAMASDGPARMRELVRYAALAANGHNTQPWKFALKENAIEIHPDYARSLRSQFQSAMGMRTTLSQLLVRFGYAETLPRSLRRPVEQVII